MNVCLLFKRRFLPQSNNSLTTCLTGEAAADSDLISPHLELSAMAGRLDSVITNMVEVFMEYSENGGKGNKHKLNKEELKSVLDKEIQSSELKGEINTDDIEQAMELMDKNHDGEVNFREFCRCICDLSKCYYQKKTGRGGKKGKGSEQEGEAAE